MLRNFPHCQDQSSFEFIILCPLQRISFRFDIILIAEKQSALILIDEDQSPFIHMYFKFSILKIHMHETEPARVFLDNEHKS